MASSVSFKKPAATAAATTTPAPATATQASVQAAKPAIAKPVAPAKPKPKPAPVEQTLAAAQEPVTETVAETVDETPTTTLATQDENQLVTDDFYKGVGAFEGEWDSRDMATPYLSLVGKTSKAFDAHPDWLGQFLYDKEYPLGNSIKVVFLRATKYFVEDLPFGTTQIPQRFSRMADARAAGFNDSTLRDVADLDLLLEVDADIEGVSELAHIIDGDKAYILARYAVQSTSFGRTASILAKDMSGFLQGNLINGFYTITSESKTGQKGTYCVPSMKTEGKTPMSLRQQIVDRMGVTKAA